MRALLEESFRAAVAAADPLKILAAHLPPPPRGPHLRRRRRQGRRLDGARGREALLRRRLEGIAITRYGHGLPTQRIRVVEAGHPVPDEAGEAAAREILAEREELASRRPAARAALRRRLEPAVASRSPGVAMAELKALTGQLLKSGATIQEMNTVRKHLSAIQGGRLAAACRAPVLALIISDVTGDDPTHIASGPCAPDPTTIDDAKAVLAKYGIDFRGPFSETPKPGDAAFGRTNKVIATALPLARGGGRGVPQAGHRAGDPRRHHHRGGARGGDGHGALARRATSGPAALISGGECTVTVDGEGGRGGRCAEFLLSLGIELDGVPKSGRSPPTPTASTAPRTTPARS